MAGAKGRSGGHNRKPTRDKVLHGTFRKDRATPDEPTAEVGLPEAPGDLDARALEEWQRVGPSLVRRGILDKSEQFVLATYCRGVSDVERLRAVIADEGDVIAGTRGTLVRHPATHVLNEANRRAMDAAARLGLTPADRGRISALPSEDAESVSGALDRAGKR